MISNIILLLIILLLLIFLSNPNFVYFLHKKFFEWKPTDNIISVEEIDRKEITGQSYSYDGGYEDYRYIIIIEKYTYESKKTEYKSKKIYL